MSTPLEGQQSPSGWFTDRGRLHLCFSCPSCLGCGNCPSTAARRRKRSILYCIVFDPGAGPGWVLPAGDVSPVVLWHFSRSNIVSEPVLTEICPNASQKPSVKKSSSSSHMTDSIAGPLVFLGNYSCPVS